MNHTQSNSVMADTKDLPPPTGYLVTFGRSRAWLDKALPEYSKNTEAMYSESAVRALLARGSAAAPAAPASPDAKLPASTIIQLMPDYDRSVTLGQLMEFARAVEATVRARAAMAASKEPQA